MKIQAITAAALLALSFTLSAAGDPQADFKASYDEAEAARKKAGSVGGEWRDTGKILKKAAKAAEKGDYAKAMKMAETARMQGELGYQQAVEQQGKDLTPPYLK